MLSLSPMLLLARARPRYSCFPTYGWFDSMLGTGAEGKLETTIPLFYTSSRIESNLECLTALIYERCSENVDTLPARGGHQARSLGHCCQNVGRSFVDTGYRRLEA